MQQARRPTNAGVDSSFSLPQTPPLERRRLAYRCTIGTLVLVSLNTFVEAETKRGDDNRMNLDSLDCRCHDSCICHVE
jgi:hypothetical protein